MIKKILITGGAGFIGVNTAKYFADKGWQVIILDNLSRRGTDDNMNWLKSQAEIRFEKIDVRNHLDVNRIVKEIQPNTVLHLAGQVAVTTSVTNPREDFDINAVGTFNVLESVRLYSPETFVINASTNKVYGKMEELGIEEIDGRYEYRDLKEGVSENQRLDFHSPYGCSKGTGDQYTIDYSRIYNLHAVTFRQSCIYGTRQFGIEDQGWVAWFTIASVLGKQITLYGDGKQIRDVLHVNDLARAYKAAIEHRETVCGHAFNIGGGSNNTLSLLELLSHLEKELDRKIPINWDNWRPGDQPVFVCNISKAKEKLGWEPAIPVKEGIRHLIAWVRENEALFSWLK